MFHHVVMFTFQEGTTEADKQAILDGLGALPAAIPEIRSYAFGRDAGLAEGNFELVVVGTFDDEAAFVRYRDHPVHQELIATRIRPVVAKRSAVQFSG